MSSRHSHINKTVNDAYRAREAAKGLVRVEVRVPAEERGYIIELARNLREAKKVSKMHPEKVDKMHPIYTPSINKALSDMTTIYNHRLQCLAIRYIQEIKDYPVELENDDPIYFYQLPHWQAKLAETKPELSVVYHADSDNPGWNVFVKNDDNEYAFCEFIKKQHGKKDTSTARNLRKAAIDAANRYFEYMGTQAVHEYRKKHGLKPISQSVRV